LEGLKGRDNMQDICVNGRIIFEWSLEKQDGKVQTGFTWLKMGSVAGSCEHANVSLGIKRQGIS
jgi:hypothetical protein